MNKQKLPKLIPIIGQDKGELPGGVVGKLTVKKVN